MKEVVASPLSIHFPLSFQLVEREIFACQPGLIEQAFKNGLFSVDEIENLYRSFDAKLIDPSICVSCKDSFGCLDSETGEYPWCFEDFVLYNTNMRILIVEDELKLANNIKQGLTESGFAVDQAFDGEEGQYLAESEDYDVIILDVMLPKIDGIAVCRELRKKQIKTPILMLTAKARLEEKIEGLDVGADDYLTKPFEFAELKSRINALLRRSHNQPETVITIGDLVIDPTAHTVKRKDKNIVLTAKEFAILEFLARHKDEVVTRTQIIEHTWDYNFDTMSNIVDVFIATLRKKIEEGSPKKLLHTVRGVGFKLSEKK